MEFLGDAVIGLVIASTLMDLFPLASEGKLSRWRSGLVSRKTLAEVADGLDFGNRVLLGRGELRTGGATKRSILAGTFEAIVGALFVDAGLEKVSEFLRHTFKSHLTRIADGGETVMKSLDKKTHLQERIQSVYKITPIYRVARTWGPEHEKEFRVEIVIGNKVVAEGNGRSKKEAEQQAASIAIEILGL